MAGEDRKAGYRPVIGLEVHAQLLTRSKAFSSDKNEYGAMPNTNVTPITLGHPGTLPKLNERVLHYALKLGLACGSDISERIHFDRKNYFYADLPKGYQITQERTPICRGGSLPTEDEKGQEKAVRLTRIHMEEDAGKSIHDQDPWHSLIDLNRAGVPLLEIVTEPDINSPTEAYHYLSEIRRLVRYLDICDGNMEEGSLRCDANVSVMHKDSGTYGTRTEVKNMNSVRNVKRALEFEIERHIDLLEKGEKVVQETRNFDAVSGKTIGLRGKEEAHDYRYFPEPDLQPIRITEKEMEAARADLPPMPRQLFQKYTEELGLSEYDAGVMTDEKSIALFFEDLIGQTQHYKAAANWVMGPVKSWLNENAASIEDLPISAIRIAELIALVNSGKVSHSVAEQEIFPVLLQNPDQTPEQVAEEKDLIQDSDESKLLRFVEEALAQYPDKVEEYKNGKTGLVKLFMGEVMKRSKGKADPKTADKLVRQKLEEE